MLNHATNHIQTRYAQVKQNSSMKENSPYWIKLLKFYHYSERRTGLTIPFIIGSKQYYQNPKLQTITELIEEVKSFNEQKTALYYCNQIKEYILTIDPNFTNGYAKNTISFNNLIIFPSTSFLKGVDELVHIIDCLDVFYNPKIHSEEFSVENGIWGSFSEKDKTLITNAFKSE